MKKDPLFQKEQKCQTCKGHGFLVKNACKPCGGHGTTLQEVKKEISKKINQMIN